MHQRIECYLLLVVGLGHGLLEHDLHRVLLLLRAVPHQQHLPERALTEHVQDIKVLEAVLAVWRLGDARPRRRVTVAVPVRAPPPLRGHLDRLPAAVLGRGVCPPLAVLHLAPGRLDLITVLAQLPAPVLVVLLRLRAEVVRGGRPELRLGHRAVDGRPRQQRNLKLPRALRGRRKVDEVVAELEGALGPGGVGVVVDEGLGVQLHPAALPPPAPLLSRQDARSAAVGKGGHDRAEAVSGRTFDSP